MVHKSHEQSSEDYLKAMFILQEKGAPIRPVDLSVQIGYTKPSISRAISVLCREQLLYKDKEGYIHLTTAGFEAAGNVYARHQFFKEMLLDAGVDSDLAELEACQMEHAVCEDTFKKLRKHTKKK